MIEIRTVTSFEVDRAPWRDSWAALDNVKPLAVEHLLNCMISAVAAGATLPIHVADIEGRYLLVLDGHFALDVYEAMGRMEFQVIVHSDVTTLEQARERYVSMNYLRSSEWLRSGVKLQKTLATIGITRAYSLMQDPDLAKDLITRSEEQWEAFSKEVLLRDHEQDKDEEQGNFFDRE